VFEPRWWQTMWRSGPAMGFASAALLAAAILAHGFARPVTPATGTSVAAVQVDTAQIERRVEAQVNARVDGAVAKAVNEVQVKQTAELAQVLKAAEVQRKADLATFQQAAEYYEKQEHRYEVASNVGPAQ